MKTPAPGEVTGLLPAWCRGERSALNRLVPLVYTELRRLAHRHMRAQPLEVTLQTTALVNETYVKLAGAAGVSCRDRAHFLALCAQVMRRILVDFARSRGSSKRGGGGHRIEFSEAFHAGPASAQDVLRLDHALTALARIDARKAKAVELRFFGGLTVDEAAEALGISRETVLRDWRLARAWLKSEVSRAGLDG